MRLSSVACFLALMGTVCLTSVSQTQREKRIFGSIRRLVNNAANAVAGTATGAANAVADTATDAVDFVKDTANDIGDGVVDMANVAAKIPKKIGKGVSSITKKALRTTYNKAKKSFKAIKKIPKSINFDKAVDALIPILIDSIDSTLTNVLCETSCVASATSVMGPNGGFVATLACAPLCEATLAKLEDIAEG
ncbi:conotoxin [Elysia marginata]|uniref:Conotoxin n=1 Tax=Elysia marginata TaxID=1093978 RepID=A0AAV4HV50_9GAST|nr:conotoxin [Elysia marginata]